MSELVPPITTAFLSVVLGIGSGIAAIEVLDEIGVVPALTLFISFSIACAIVVAVLFVGASLAGAV